MPWSGIETGFCKIVRVCSPGAIFLFTIFYTAESLEILVLTRVKDFLEDPVTQLQILVVICRKHLQLEFSVMKLGGVDAVTRYCWRCRSVTDFSRGEMLPSPCTVSFPHSLCLQVVIAGWPVHVIRCVTPWSAMVFEAFDVWKDVRL